MIAVAVVGAGPAGLSISCELTKAGVEHVVLERGRIGQTWRDRWDNFCLVTPNWSVQLPDGHYDGPDPDAFMPRDEMVAYLERYASKIAAPVRENLDVSAIESRPEGGFVLETSEGALGADAVVFATGAFKRSYRPAAATLPPELFQIDVDDYRNEAALPPGAVLVVGSGQSGCQIAEELHEAGRKVVLACGRAPGSHAGSATKTLCGGRSRPVPRRARRLTPCSGGTALRQRADDGAWWGHDLHLRTLQAQGVVLAGHFLGATDTHVRFAPDLAESVAWGDERYAQFHGARPRGCGEAWARPA